jgi:hypothetical protein
MEKQVQQPIVPNYRLIKTVTCKVLMGVTAVTVEMEVWVVTGVP